MRRYILRKMFDEIWVEAAEEDLRRLYSQMNRLKLPYLLFVFRSYSDAPVRVCFDRRAEPEDYKECEMLINEIIAQGHFTTLPRHFTKLRSFLPGEVNPRAYWHYPDELFHYGSV